MPSTTSAPLFQSLHYMVLRFKRAHRAVVKNLWPPWIFCSRITGAGILAGAPMLTFLPSHSSSCHVKTHNLLLEVYCCLFCLQEGFCWERKPWSSNRTLFVHDTDTLCQKVCFWSVVGAGRVLRVLRFSFFIRSSQAVLFKLPETGLDSDLSSNQFLHTAIHLDWLAHRSWYHQ